MELKYEKRSSYGIRTKKIAYLKDMNLPLYEIFLTQLGMNIKGNSFVFEYIVKVTKQPTLWISFNTVYSNNIHTDTKIVMVFDLVNI